MTDQEKEPMTRDTIIARYRFNAVRWYARMVDGTVVGPMGHNMPLPASSISQMIFEERGEYPVDIWPGTVICPCPPGYDVQLTVSPCAHFITNDRDRPGLEVQGLTPREREIAATALLMVYTVMTDIQELHPANIQSELLKDTGYTFREVERLRLKFSCRTRKSGSV